MQREIRFRSQGVTIRGYLLLPAGSTTGGRGPPVLILSHGFSALSIWDCLIRHVRSAAALDVLHLHSTMLDSANRMVSGTTFATGHKQLATSML